MSTEPNNHQNNGFFFGFILGILATFLLGTKKGREVLRRITKEGPKKIDEWKEVLSTEDFLSDEEDDETDYIKETPIGSHIRHEKYPTHGRRFFKRLRKE